MEVKQHVGPCTGQLVSNASEFDAGKLRADVAEGLALERYETFDATRREAARLCGGSRGCRGSGAGGAKLEDKGRGKKNDIWSALGSSMQEVATFMAMEVRLRVPERNTSADNIPWVKTTDLSNGLITETEERLTKLGLEDSSCKMVPAKAVVVAMYGGFYQIGRTGSLRTTAQSIRH